MTLQGQQKLGRLIVRLVDAESRALTDSGREFMASVLRYRLGLTTGRPHMAQRGRPVDVVRYERRVIEERVDRALAQPEVRDEAEAAGVLLEP